jgi:hypothetical protein
MTIEQAADWATVVGVALAIPALMVGAVQLWLQRETSHREKIVQVYFDCVRSYADLQKERANFEDEAASLASTDSRRERNRVAFWDLMATTASRVAWRRSVGRRQLSHHLGARRGEVRGSHISALRRIDDRSTG